MAQIRFAALDGSLRNFGVAKMEINTETGELTVIDLILIKTEPGKGKQVRASSDNLRRSQELAIGVREATKDCVTAFYEVPSGGQDYKSVLGFGMVIGIYASLTIPGREVSPAETKMAAVGTKTASKEEMVIWAVEKHPDAPWRLQKQNGAKYKKGDLMADNEHLADGVAIGYAGTKTPEFQQMIAMMNSMSRAA